MNTNTRNVLNRLGAISIASLLFMLMCVLLTLLTGCAAHGRPYAVEYAVQPPLRPFSREGNGTKVVRIYNPFPDAVDVDVWCPGNIDGHSAISLTVAGSDSTSFLVQENNRDLTLPDTCVIRGWHFVGLEP